MKFSIVMIAKNEASTLPRMLASLGEFKQRGGEVVILDTGSTDETTKVAREWGCKVEEVGELFLMEISQKMADEVNEKFIEKDEDKILQGGDKIFDFASARNHASSLASNNFIVMPDCDEAFTRLGIDAIEKAISDGASMIEDTFVFSHDAYGNPLVKFKHCKMYDRSKLHWEGIIHECLQGDGGKRVFIGEDEMLTEHWQNHASNRSGYLKGLAIDCLLHPENDRNSHYFARELMWCGRPKSAIKEFKRHVAMNRWQTEKGQSYVHMGSCYLDLGEVENALASWKEAWEIEPRRREPLIRLADYYYQKKDAQRASCYASASLEIPWMDFYTNNASHYREVPHEILYWAKWQLGDKEGSKYHLDKCLEYSPQNPRYLKDTQFYYEYPDQGIEGWMLFPELTWLYETAKKMGSILEIGSWQGRSTHALCSGCKGLVTSVDTFEGSDDPKDLTYKQGERLGVYDKFMKNVGHFKNLEVFKMSSKEAKEKLGDRKFDMVFIDANHTYEGVMEDIALWKDNAKVILCGHDYTFTWLGVKKAVDESIGEPDKLAKSIWIKHLSHGNT